MKRKIDITKDNRDMFYNRGHKLWFEYEGNNTYSIHTDLDYILEHVCVNYDELPEDATEYDDEYTDQFGRKHKCKNHSFDPPGGPYIAVGSYKIGGKVVERIYTENKKTLFKVTK